MSLLNPIDFSGPVGFTSAAVDASDSPTATRHGNTTVANFKCGIRRCSLSFAFLPATDYLIGDFSFGTALRYYFL
jgi:hypothetical protein